MTKSRGLMPQRRGKWAAFIEHAVAYAGGECLIWPFGKDERGYGLISGGGRGKFRVHRLICEMSHGPAPDGSSVCAHYCGNPSCVAPNHLRWTTQRDNLDDRYTHGTVNRGTRNGGAKLNEESVRQIRALRAQGLSCAQIAERFPVNSRTVNKIVLRQKWAWL